MDNGDEAASVPSGPMLWASIGEVYEIEEPHEKALLAELCRVADVVADLQKQADKDGPMIRQTLHGVRELRAVQNPGSA